MMDERSTVICLINDCGFIIYLINLLKYVPSSSATIFYYINSTCEERKHSDFSPSPRKTIRQQKGNLILNH